MLETMRFSGLLLVGASVAFLGCGSGGSSFKLDGGSGDDAGTLPDLDGSFAGDRSAPPPPPKTVLYANSDTELYELDPTNLAKALAPIGKFDCLGGTASAMTDIAVDKSGKLYGVSQVAAYPLTIQGTTVHCDANWQLPSQSRFYGLTFAPEGTLGPGEVLVAANGDGQLFTIDSNGKTTQVGTFGNDAQNKPYGLSGDIVFLANKGVPLGFATVRSCGANCTNVPDTLVQIDLAKMKAGFTGSVVKSVRGVLKQGTGCANPMAPPSFGSMYGVAAYQDKIFGFSRAGGIVTIDNGNAGVCFVATPLEGGMPLKFAGAGVTTVVDVIAPPN
jgi:hypothetical protein